jgi:hypothetical protein
VEKVLEGKIVKNLKLGNDRKLLENVLYQQ